MNLLFLVGSAKGRHKISGQPPWKVTMIPDIIENKQIKENPSINIFKVNFEDLNFDTNGYLTTMNLANESSDNKNGWRNLKERNSEKRNAQVALFFHLDIIKTKLSP